MLINWLKLRLAAWPVMHTCFVHVQQASIMHRNCCLLVVLQLSSLFISTIEIIWQYVVFGGICVNCRMWNQFSEYWACGNHLFFSRNFLSVVSEQ